MQSKRRLKQKQDVKAFNNLGRRSLSVKNSKNDNKLYESLGLSSERNKTNRHGKPVTSTFRSQTNPKERPPRFNLTTNTTKPFLPSLTFQTDSVVPEAITDPNEVYNRYMLKMQNLQTIYEFGPLPEPKVEKSKTPEPE